jgi:hypothetical protein
MPRPAGPDEAVAEAVRVSREFGHRTSFIGIDGFGAAGKSSLATAIAATVERAELVHLDDFSGPDLPEWDWCRFDAQVSVPLLAGRRARYQVWRWGRDEGGEWREVPPGAVVVVEGVSSTRAEVRLPWDLTIWVDAPRDVRLARALARDGAAAMPVWTQQWMPSEEAYAARERPCERADLLVDGWRADPSGTPTLERS